jgi:hypothetical protein
MKLILGIAFIALVAAGLASCSGNKCGAKDWCACSGGTECFQTCDDVDGCRFFCFEMTKCGASCGARCNFDFHDAKENSIECGDTCNITCRESTSCNAICGAGCTYSSYDTDTSQVRAGADSTVSCTNVKSCVVECLGACRVFCADGVDTCEVTCPGGASPISCPNGSLACGACS